jgi:hypothetical protein
MRDKLSDIKRFLPDGAYKLYLEDTIAALNWVLGD